MIFKLRKGSGRGFREGLYHFFTKIMFLPGKGVGAALSAEPVVKKQFYEAILRQE
jgi:hypothetical protein